MNWLELAEEFERGSRATQISVKAISEPLESADMESPYPELNVRLFHDGASHIVHFKTSESSEVQSVHPGFLISPSSGFRRVAEILSEKPFVLILDEDRTERIICWQDLNRPALASWLFAQISLLESMLRVHIEFALKTLECRDGKTWEDFLSPKQQEAFGRTWNALIAENAETGVLEAMTFSQLKTIAVKLYSHKMGIGNWSRKEVDKGLFRIGKYRNPTAHSRSYLKRRDDVAEFMKMLDELRRLNRDLATRLNELECYEFTRYAAEGQVYTVGDCLPPEVETRCFISAMNPKSQELTDHQNQDRHQELCGRLVEKKCQFQAGIATDPAGTWPSEECYCIDGLAFEEALELAKEFDQGTIFWADSIRPFGIYLIG